MDKIIAAVTAGRLRDPAIYALLILLLALFYTGSIAEARLVLAFMVVYALSVSVLHYLTLSKLKKLGLEEQNAEPFIKKLEKNYLFLFIAITLLAIAASFLVLKKLSLGIFLVPIALFAAGAPKNIFLASQFFLLRRIYELRGKGMDAGSQIRSAAFTDTLIANDADVIEKNLDLRGIFADWQMYRVGDFDNSDKLIRFLAICNEEKNVMDAAIVKAYKLDIPKMREAYQELEWPHAVKNIYFYDVDGRNTAIIRGDVASTLEKCDFIEQDGKIKPLSFGGKRDLLGHAGKFQLSNLNTLAIAYKEYKTKKIEGGTYGFVFLALLVFGRGSKKEFFHINKVCNESGIRLLFVSKEKYEVAGYIAMDAGIISNAGDVIVWKADTTDQELLEQLRETRVVSGADDLTGQRIAELLEKNKAKVFDGPLSFFTDIYNESRAYFFNLANFVRYNLIFGFLLFLLFFGNLLMPAIVPAFHLSNIVLFAFLFYLPSFALAFETGVVKYKSNLVNLFGSVNLVLAIFSSVVAVGIISYLHMLYGISGAFFAFIAVNAFNLLNVNSLRKSIFASFNSNIPICLSFLLIMLVAMAFFFYAPLHEFLGMARIAYVDFAIIAVISIGAVILEEIRKLAVRY